MADETPEERLLRALFRSGLDAESGLDEFHPDTTHNPSPRFDALLFAFVAVCTRCGDSSNHKTTPEAINWQTAHRCQEVTT